MSIKLYLLFIYLFIQIELGQKDDQYRLIIDQKNKEIEELTKKIIECQTDMEKLVEQIDKQKQEAAENI